MFLREGAIKQLLKFHANNPQIDARYRHHSRAVRSYFAVRSTRWCHVQVARWVSVPASWGARRCWNSRAFFFTWEVQHPWQLRCCTWASWTWKHRCLLLQTCQQHGHLNPQFPWGGLPIRAHQRVVHCLSISVHHARQANAQSGGKARDTKIDLTQISTWMSQEIIFGLFESTSPLFAWRAVCAKFISFPPLNN